MAVFWKSVVTLAIWMMVGGIVLTGLIMDSPDIVPIAIAALIAAGVSTGVIHSEEKNAKKATSQAQVEVYEKAKRTGSDPDAKMRLLMELMDEDERIAFKETLKRQVLSDARVNSDGELNYDADTLAALLEDEDRYSRR